MTNYCGDERNQTIKEVVQKSPLLVAKWVGSKLNTHLKGVARR